MPELPEVESVRAALAGELAGRRVEACGCRMRAARRGRRRRRFASGLHGRAFTELGRRGKLLLRRLDDGGKLAVHLRMTGRLLLAEAGEATRRTRARRFCWMMGANCALWTRGASGGCGSCAPARKIHTPAWPALARSRTTRRWTRRICAALAARAGGR